MEDDINNLNFAEEDEDENGLYDPSNPTAGGKKKKKVIELTDQEKDRIKATVEEMKQNQVQPQHSVGRVFKGPGFVSKPAKIVYKDFEVGKKMSLTIELTNASYSFNSFHLQPLDDDIIDFFEIDYRPCGRIPPGISTKMTLHFTPLVNKDYKSNLKLLSETGLCEIPIECLCKKCLISFEKEKIDYGEVILGQEINKLLVVNSTGALSCKYTIVDTEKEPLANPDDEDDNKENEPELEQSYKDFTDRTIILHKYDYINANDKTPATIIEELRKQKVAEFREKTINEERENYEKREKEKEEQEQAALAQNPKGKPAAAKKKPNPKDKKPEVELVNGVPVEIMNDIEKRVKEYEENYKVESEEDKKIFDEKDAKLKFKNMKYYMLKQLTYSLKGNIKGYSKKKLPIVLNAKYIGSYNITAFLKIEYTNKIEYKQIQISFSVVDLPIYSEKKIYELNHIIYDTIFREKLVLVNDSPMPYKLQVFFHKDLKEYIELNPNLGYIQANSKFEVWVKLRVDRNVHNLVSFFKGKKSDDENDPDKDTEFNFPLKIVLNNIEIPLIAVLHFHVTNDIIKLSEKMINYGKRQLDESTKVIMSLENLSRLPMKYGFIMLPKEFTVRLNIDTLLSKEKTFVDVVYDPKDDFVGHREGDIFCKVVTDDLTCQNIKIQYHIELINPEIKITPKKIKFESLAEGEYKELRIIIFNKNPTKSFICEFLSPPKCFSGLTIMPKVFSIEPKGYTTCVIRFDSEMRDYNAFTYEEIEKEIGIKLADGLEQLEKEAEIEGNKNELIDAKVKTEVETTLNKQNETGDKKKKGAAPEKKKEVKKIEPKKDKKALEEEERKKKEEEERILKEIEDKKQERIATFNKEKELKHFGAEHIFIDKEGDRSSHWRFVIPLFYKDIALQKDNTAPMKASFIEVQTTCVEKFLVFDKTEIDFGEVSVQTRKTVNLLLTNKSDKVAKLKMKTMIITNCFSIVNVVRDIQPHQNFNFIVEFLPQKDLPYYDEFTVYTSEAQSTVKLKGIGVRPDVETSVKDGILFLGNSVVNNTIEKTFDIINKSHFKIEYTLTSLKSGKKNKTGLQPFCYIPYCGEIGPKGKVTVKVTFNGDNQDFENFFDFVLVDVPNQKVDNKILFSAFCWDRQVYWKELTELKFPDEAFMSKVIEQDVFVDCLKLKSNSPSSNNEEVILVFTPEKGLQEPEEKCFKRKLIIGNCKMNDPKNEKNGGYEVMINKDDPYFTCDNPKGAVNSGTETVVTFNFKKPNPDPVTKDIALLKGVGMWVTSKVELKINGGFIQPGAQDAVTAIVVLKAYIEQL